MLLNLNDSDAWSHAMVALAWDRDQREKLRMLALEQAGRFNGQASAARLLELYAEAVSLPKRYLGGGLTFRVLMLFCLGSWTAWFLVPGPGD